MAVQNVTATRMTLLSLKNQTKVAQRGHKLLKDKQDGIMQEFLKIVHKAKALRLEVEEAIRAANASFLLAQAVLPKEVLENTLSNPSQRLSLQVKTKNIMSVRIPVFELKTEGNVIDYSLLQTRGELDLAITEFAKSFRNTFSAGRDRKISRKPGVRNRKNTTSSECARTSSYPRPSRHAQIYSDETRRSRAFGYCTSHGH